MTSEGNGGFELAKADQIEALPGVARDESGMLLAAAEVVNVPAVPRVDGGRTNIILRGVTTASPKLRPQFQIVQGRYFIPGARRVHREQEHFAPLPRHAARRRLPGAATARLDVIKALREKPPSDRSAASGTSFSTIIILDKNNSHG